MAACLLSGVKRSEPDLKPFLQDIRPQDDYTDDLTIGAATDEQLSTLTDTPQREN